MHRKIEAAYELMRTGDLAAAEAQLEVALRDPALTAKDRTHAFARLSSCYRITGRRAEALRTARDASVIAVVSDDDQTQAVADFMLGNAAIDVFFADNQAEELLAEGMQALERAADAYERLGAIDLASVVLTMAEVARAVGQLDAARALYLRVQRELDDPRWRGPEAIVRHVIGARARCCAGLAAVALASSDAAEAKAQLAAAFELVLAAPDPGSRALLEELAAGFDALRDREAAARVREATRELSTAP